MAKKRIFYSIDVDCEDQDILNYIRINHPGIKFNYEYVEDIETHKNNLHHLFADLGDILSGKTLRDIDKK